MEEKNNKKMILAIIGVIVLIAGVVGLTVAYFMAQAESENITVTSKSLTLKYGPDPDSEIIATDIGPITEEEITTEAVTKTFSIAKQNDTDKDVYARIDIADIEISDNFKDYDLKWALYQGEEKVTTGSFVQTLDGSDTINMANNVLISSTTPIEYTLYIWIQETEQDQSELMSGTLTAKIRITGESEKQNTLASKILGDNNSKVTTTSPTFSTTSTDLGLFVQQDDSEKSNYGFPTYYYRGSVTNNYVQLGTYKSDITNTVWEYYEEYDEYYDSSVKVASTNDAILWRIVRINEDGSIKLISENNSVDKIYNSNGTVYYVNPDGTDSEMKSAIEKWYNTHITESNIDNIIQYGDYCNDISYGEDSSSYYWYAPVVRATNLTPIFTCPNEAVMVNEKIGIITSDEIIYAGFIPNRFISTSYLDNNTIAFGTISPSVIDKTLSKTLLFSVQKDIESGITLSSNQFYTDVGSTEIRATITIKADTLISGGSGLENDPYIIKID